MEVGFLLCPAANTEMITCSMCLLKQRLASPAAHDATAQKQFAPSVCLLLIIHDRLDRLMCSVNLFVVDKVTNLFVVELVTDCP